MAAGRALIGIFFLMLGQAAFAGEIQTLAWETENGAPVLRVQLSGAATFEAMTLEHGQRLRVSFPDSTLSPAQGTRWAGAGERRLIPIWPNPATR